MNKGLKGKQYIVPTVLLAMYLVFNGILLLGHEMWRDEANVWLVARDMTPLQLFREIKYQGHPCLWYLIAMPFAKLGFPFKTLSVLSFLIMGGAAAILSYKGPFHVITKAVILLSPMTSYYYPVVARNYCLIAGILILLAYYYPKRNEKSLLYGLLLGLLVQADVIALASAGLISLMWFWECVMKAIRQKTKEPLLIGAKGLWIPLAGVVLLALQFMGVSDSPEYRMHMLPLGEMLREIKNFSYHILTRMTGQGTKFDLLLIVLFVVSGILLSIKSKNIWPSVVMAGAFLFEVVFSIMIYQLHIWHYIALCFSLIWCLWVYAENANTAKAGRLVSEVLLVLLGVTMFLRWNSPEESSSLSNAWNGLYSDGVYAAEYIKEHIGTDEVILSTNVSEVSTVQAYLGNDYSFYFVGNGKAATYASYTEEERRYIAYEEVLQWVKNSFPEKKEFYLLASPNSYIEETSEEVMKQWEICYQTKDKSARGEEYTIYRIGLQE